MAAELLPIILSVKAANWRMNDDGSAEADSEFQLVRKKVLERDEFSCRFCAFKAPKYQEVHHLNDDHSDNRPQNLVTACIYCHLCAHIGLAGKNNEAVLVWLPEIEQAALHHVVRTIQFSAYWGKKHSVDKRTDPKTQAMAKMIASTASALEGKLRAREAGAQRLLGTSDPLELSNLFLKMPNEVYARRGEILTGIRLLPLGRRVQEGGDIMGKIVEGWETTGGPYSSLNPRVWHSMMQNILPDV